MNWKDGVGVKVRRPVDTKYRISAEFGSVNPALRDGKPHRGVDFACPVGTPVVACFDGQLLLQKDETQGDVQQKKAGKRVGLYSRGLRALYFHLSEFYYPLPGETVKKGDIIAYSGNTGHSTGPHLHFELRILATDEPVKPEFEEDKNDKAIA